MLDEARRTGVTMEDNEEEYFDDHFPNHVGFDVFDNDTVMEEPEVEAAENDPTDDRGQALHGAWQDCESKKERMKFQQMLEDHRKLLYPGFEDGLIKNFGITLELLQWKATHGVFDKEFGELLSQTACLLFRIGGT